MKEHHVSKCILLVMLLCLFSTATFAQEQTVTIDVRNATLKQVFGVIEKQTSYRISYRNVFIDNRKDITISKKKASVKDVLNYALSGRQLEYSIISSKAIVITDKRKEEIRSNQSGDMKKVSGTVKDANGEPIIGATIRVKGSSNAGTITDTNGNFSIVTSPNAELEITYIGYMAKSVRTNNGSNFNIQMQEDRENLDEVIVIGYGKEKKITTTSSVTKVDGEQLSKMTVANPEKSLQGLSSGLTIVDRGGSPGDDNPEIYLRGVSTTGYSQPLVLVDGVEMSLSQIPSSDIDNISVLKDASSTSIYGSRAANGVILVTTKRGKEGKFSVTYNGTIGFQDRAVKAEAVSSREYQEMVNEALINSSGVAKYSEEEIIAT